MRQLERGGSGAVTEECGCWGQAGLHFLFHPGRKVQGSHKRQKSRGSALEKCHRLIRKQGCSRMHLNPCVPPWQCWGSPAAQPCPGSPVALASPKQDSSPAACGSCDKVPLLNFGSCQHWKAVRWWGRRPRSPGLLKHAPTNMLFKKLL